MTRYGLYGLPEPELPKRPPSKWRWPLRIVIGAAVAVGITLVLLSRQGGNSDSLKEFLEQYLSDSSGYIAEIDTLNAVSFYPVLGADFDGLVFRDRGNREIKARLGHVNFSVGFWGASFGRSAIRTFSITKGEIDAGIVTPEKIIIEDLSIDLSQGEAPVLRFNGHYGQEKMTAAAGLERKTTWLGAPYFVLADGKKLTLEAGPVQLESLIGTGKKGERALTVLSLTTGQDHQPLKGLVEISRGLNKIILKGNLRSTASHIDYALEFINKDGTRAVEGTVFAPVLDLGDVLGTGGLIESYRVVKDVYRGTQPLPVLVDLASPPLQLKTRVEKLTMGGMVLGAVQAPVATNENGLHLGPLTGQVLSGTIAGDIMIDARTSPATQTVALQILEPGNTGLRLELAAQGETMAALQNGLKGQMTVVTQGTALSALLHALWGGRLVDAMLPDASRDQTLSLRCGLGDVTIDGGRVSVKTLVLDLPGFVGMGTGNLDLEKIDLTLNPAAQGGQSLRISGALDAPSIRKTSSNQAALPQDIIPAYSLEAMGLDPSHSCKDYLKQ